MNRYGAKAAARTPPIRRMLDLGIPVGAGTDATRVASYNLWVSLYWLVTGQTLGGYGAPLLESAATAHVHTASCGHHHKHHATVAGQAWAGDLGLWGSGCGCFAF